MDKFDFITELRAKLWSIPEEDAVASVEYYAEMIDERMEEGLSEEEAVAAIGDLDEIVKNILAETPAAEPVKQVVKQRRKLSWWEITLLVLGSPVWVSLLIAVASVVFAVFVSLWAVVISLYAVSFALAVSALGLLVAAFSQLWIRRYAECAVTAGGALVCAGAAILLFLLSNLAAKGLAALTRLIWKGATGIFTRKERSA